MDTPDYCPLLVLLVHLELNYKMNIKRDKNINKLRAMETNTTILT